MTTSPYQQARQQSRTVPAGPKLPALGLILNYPPASVADDDVELVKDELVRFVAFYSLFGPDSRLTPVGREALGPGFVADRWEETITAMVPRGPGPLITEYYSGRDVKARPFASAFVTELSRRYVQSKPSPNYFTYSGSDPGLVLTKSLIRCCAADEKYRVYEGTSWDDLGESVVVEGLENAFGRIYEVVDEAQSGQKPPDGKGSYRLHLGLTVSSPALEVHYRDGKSDFSRSRAGDALAGPGDKTPEAYFDDRSSVLIREVRKINSLFNVLASLSPHPCVGPDQPNESALPPDLTIEVGGHTDRTVPVTMTNQTLSLRRAENIVKFLSTDPAKTEILASPIAGATFKDLFSTRLVAKGYGPDECPPGPGDSNPTFRRITLRLRPRP